ncbi:MAG TPA: hypothetical protein VHX11_03260 [Acidobacteriaceae bacterium]|nr:hypothetical protein [Acidobacteriaceae bacterium]
MNRPASPLRKLIQSDAFLIALALLGTLLRLAIIFKTRHQPPFYDETTYHDIALALLHGEGFKDINYFTAYRPPAQPAFAAIIFGIFGDHYLPVRIFEALLLAIIPFICSRVGHAIGLSPFAANVGAALAAFHPAIAYASSTIYPTILTTIAVTLGVWLSWQAFTKNRTTTAVAAALVLALAGAATTTFAPLAFLIGCLIALKRNFKIAIIIALVGTAPAVGWMVRNKIVMHDFALATNGGYNLLLGANDEATPRSGNWVVLTPDWTKGEVYLDRQQAKQAKQWISTHRAHYAELVILRAFVVFDSVGKPATAGLHESKLAQIVAWSLLPIMLFGLLGMFLKWKHPITWFSAAALGLVILSSAFTIAKPRFRLPCDPLLCVYAAAGASAVKHRFSGGSPQKQQGLSSIA